MASGPITEVKIPAEAQAKLDKLKADLKAAQARNNASEEARILSSIGIVYFGFGEKQQALGYYNQALSIERQVGDRADEVTTLIDIGVAYAYLGDKLKALDSYNKALSIARQTGDLRNEAAMLNTIGFLYLVQSENQKALDYFNQTLPISRKIGNRALEATTLWSIGIVYSNFGENSKALDYFRQALPIERQVGDRVHEAATSTNIGKTYFNLSDKQNALDYFRQALAISRTLGDLAGIAVLLNNIGTINIALGENQKALAYFNEALPIERQVGDRMDESVTLGNFGGVYSNIGEKQKAFEYYNQALLIVRQVGDRAHEAATLDAIGSIYSDLGEKEKALDCYNQALRISRQVGDRTGVGMALNNIGDVYLSLGQNQKALEYFNQALPVEQQVGARPGVATTLNNIGLIYSHLGEKQKALDNFDQALPLAAFINDARLQAVIFSNLAILEVGRPSLAVLYGKLAVNLLQQLRGNIAGLDNNTQRLFLASIADRYRHLSSLLIRQGRLLEAQQVLNLLKNQEYKDYVRGETKDSLGALSLTLAERRAEEDYQRSTTKVVEQGRQWSELKQDKARTPEEEMEFQQLSDSLGNASQMMNEYFARLYKLFSAGGDANRQVANITDETASLKQQIAKMPHAVALYTVVSEGRYSVIVISGQTMVAREYSIPDKDLYQKVAAFRQIILDPSKDPKPLAQELYRILIAPIRADLDQAKAQTLIWSLDGVLRYVPFAALYDGQHYLVENYSLASFTPVSIAHISDKPNISGVSAAAMGISAKFDERLKALPKVETELDSIVQDPQVKGSTGVMPGTILLNGKFTELAMEKQLDGQRAVVHIASHFVLRPGDDSQSYLLMAGKDGDAAGYHMTVASFRDNQKMILEGTELLTLSACDTGVGGSSANGREVDGLATTAQRKGAKAVISSLWQLNDNSTADIMADFYKRWVKGGGNVTKVEALRQAQLDLLTGKVLAKLDSSNPNAGTSYAQPYYWAPFVLMGNWQ